MSLRSHYSSSGGWTLVYTLIKPNRSILRRVHVGSRRLEKEGGGQSQRHARITLTEGPLLFQTNDPLIGPSVFPILLSHASRPALPVTHLSRAQNLSLPIDKKKNINKNLQENLSRRIFFQLLPASSKFGPFREDWPSFLQNLIFIILNPITYRRRKKELRNILRNNAS